MKAFLLISGDAKNINKVRDYFLQKAPGFVGDLIDSGKNTVTFILAITDPVLSDELHEYIKEQKLVKKVNIKNISFL